MLTKLKERIFEVDIRILVAIIMVPVLFLFLHQLRPEIEIRQFMNETGLPRHQLMQIRDAHQFLNSVVTWDRDPQPQHVPELEEHAKILGELAKKTDYQPLVRDLNRFVQIAKDAELRRTDWVILHRIVHDIDHHILGARGGSNEYWEESYSVRAWRGE